SPNKNHLIFFDVEKSSFFSLNLSTNDKVDITKYISTSIIEKSYKGSLFKTNAVGIKGWLDNSTVFIYDNYDIWKVDITGTNPPVNITNGYGKTHYIKFRLLHEANLDKGVLYALNRPLL